MSVEIIGHRGARGVLPENTLIGFEFCRLIGVTALEFDVQVTADGVPVIAHDPRPNPALTRDAAGRWLDAPAPLICETPLEALSRLDVGGLRPGTAYAARFPEQAFLDGIRIPTFADLLAWAGPQARLIVEIKSDPAVPLLAAAALTCTRAVCGLLDGHPLAARAVIQSFDWRVLALAREILPELARSHLTEAGPPSAAATFYQGSPWLTGPFLPETAAMVAGQGGQVWAPHFRDLDADGMAAARAAGISVLGWTVNEPADIARMIDLGVNGIITDYPGRAQRVLAARRDVATA